MEYVMGIDVGTNETKGVLINNKCIIVADYAVPHEIENPKPNFFEQDAEKVWWNDICKISKELLKMSNISANKVKTIGISALGCDCVPVDEQCKPLCKAILYGIDCRCHEEIKWLNNHYGDKAEEIFGHPICSSDIAPKILWIKNHLPDIYKKTYKFLTASSYLTAKLTGVYCIDKYLAEDFLPLYDLKNNKINADMCQLFCKPSQMADLLYATDIAGEISEKAAEETGLLPGTKVLTGTGDSGAEAISTGVFQPGDMMVQLGSTCYFVYLSDKLIEENRLWPGTFIIPNIYSVCAGTNTAGTLTKWFKQNFYREEEKLEREGGENAFTAMAKSIEKIPTGSDGLITLPYFAGERTPINNPFAKGMIFGLQLHHTKEHIYKSALEGVAYSIAQHVEILEKDGQPVKKIMAVGGGTKNKPWLQIIADVLDKTVYTSKVTIGAAYGDALMAALSAGFVKDWNEMEHMIQPAESYEPNENNKKLYKKYKEMFWKLYENNKDMMSEIGNKNM